MVGLSCYCKSTHCWRLLDPPRIDLSQPPETLSSTGSCESCESSDRTHVTIETSPRPLSPQSVTERSLSHGSQALLMEKRTVLRLSKLCWSSCSVTKTHGTLVEHKRSSAEREPKLSRTRALAYCRLGKGSQPAPHAVPELVHSVAFCVLALSPFQPIAWYGGGCLLC